MRQHERQPVDFVVLTGFLGSGKTTLLRDFLPTPEAADTAVIVNEAGEIDLDGVLLREVGGEVAMRTLPNGCICCEQVGELAVTIDMLLSAERPPGTPPIRRIVLETSGLAKPGPVLRQLVSLAAHRMRVGVVATFDPTRGAALDGFETAAAQWAAAGRIVVTKLDRVDREHLSECTGWAAALNPLAEIVADLDRVALIAAAFAPQRATVTDADDIATVPDPSPSGGGRTRPEAVPGGDTSFDARISTTVVRLDGPVDYDDLAAWLDNLAGALGDRLLRVKGLVRVEGVGPPLLVQSVGTLFSEPRPFAGPPAAPFLVVIALDLTSGEIEAVRPFMPMVAASRSRRAAPTRPLRAEPA